MIICHIIAVPRTNGRKHRGRIANRKIQMFFISVPVYLLKPGCNLVLLHFFSQTVSKTCAELNTNGTNLHICAEISTRTKLGSHRSHLECNTTQEGILTSSNYQEQLLGKNLLSRLPVTRFRKIVKFQENIPEKKSYWWLFIVLSNQVIL